MKSLNVDRSDFLSPTEQGRPRPPHASATGWAGVSVFDTIEEAIAQAKRFPKLGQFIAELEVPDDIPMDGPHDRGHFDLLDEPDAFAGWVIDVSAL